MMWVLEYRGDVPVYVLDVGADCPLAATITSHERRGWTWCRVVRVSDGALLWEMQSRLGLREDKEETEVAFRKRIDAMRGGE